MAFFFQPAVTNQTRFNFRDIFVIVICVGLYRPIQCSFTFWRQRRRMICGGNFTFFHHQNEWCIYDECVYVCRCSLLFSLFLQRSFFSFFFLHCAVYFSFHRLLFFNFLVCFFNVARSSFFSLEMICAIPYRDYLGFEAAFVVFRASCAEWMETLNKFGLAQWIGLRWRQHQYFYFSGWNHFNFSVNWTWVFQQIWFKFFFLIKQWRS